MARKKTPAVAYYRTSSATNVGGDKDSEKRQRDAVTAYAKANGYEIVAEFYDAAVRGADAVEARPGFAALLNRIAGNGVRAVLIEDPTRFARDLIVQLTGHDKLRMMGVELIPANAPEFFREDTPTAKLVRQVLGAISEFEKAQLVAKLRAARERTGRLGGRPPVPDDTKALAHRLYRKSPKTGKRLSLRAIASRLAAEGHLAPSGKPYGAQSVKCMIGIT